MPQQSCSSYMGRVIIKVFVGKWHFKVLCPTYLWYWYATVTSVAIQHDSGDSNIQLAPEFLRGYIQPHFCCWEHTETSHIIMVLSFLPSTLCPSLRWRNRLILFLPILSHHLQDQSTPGQSILNKALKARGAPILPSCSVGSVCNGISTTVFSSSIMQRLQPLSNSSHFVASRWSSSIRDTESKCQDNT